MRYGRRLSMLGSLPAVTISPTAAECRLWILTTGGVVNPDVRLKGVRADRSGARREKGSRTMG